MYLLSFLTFNCGCLESIAFSWTAFCFQPQWTIHWIIKIGMLLWACSGTDALQTFLTVRSHIGFIKFLLLQHLAAQGIFMFFQGSAQCLFSKLACWVCILIVSDNVLYVMEMGVCDSKPRFHILYNSDSTDMKCEVPNLPMLQKHSSVN